MTQPLSTSTCCISTRNVFQQIQQNGEKKSFGQKAVRATAEAAQQATG
jgi:hypothetical protein